MSNKEPLQCDITGANHFNTAAEKAIALSYSINRDVYFEFNGVNVTVNPDSTIEEAAKLFHGALNKKAEEYRKSPEGIEAAKQREIRAEERTKQNATVDNKIDGVELELADPEGWQAFVSANTNGTYGAGVIKYAERWAKLMQVEIAKGAKIEDIAERTSHEADNEGITGFMYGCAVSTLAKTWQHGETLRTWHNKDVQIGNEGDLANDNGGVLNPAVMSIG